MINYRKIADKSADKLVAVYTGADKAIKEIMSGLAKQKTPSFSARQKADNDIQNILSQVDAYNHQWASEEVPKLFDVGVRFYYQTTTNEPQPKIIGYHGTTEENKINIGNLGFDPNHRFPNSPIYMASDKSVTTIYGKGVIAKDLTNFKFLNISTIYGRDIVKKFGLDPDMFLEPNKEFSSWLKKNGFDGVEMPTGSKNSDYIITNVKKLNKAPTIEDINYTTAEQESIRTVADITYKNLGQTLQIMQRQASKMINEDVQKKLEVVIAKNIDLGKSTGDIAKETLKAIDEKGSIALVDSGGREWSAEDYAKMFAKTATQDIINQSVKNRMLADGITVFEFPETDNHACDECQEYSGKIFDFSGKQYPEPPYDGNIVHPNCRHSLIPRPDLQQWE